MRFRLAVARCPSTLRKTGFGESSARLVMEASMANTGLYEHAEIASLEAYKAAVEEWIAAIREEDQLASADPCIARLDEWERAHLKEEAARNKAKKAKKDYEDTIRLAMFGF
jgi:hypothetical protein